MKSKHLKININLRKGAAVENFHCNEKKNGRKNSKQSIFKKCKSS